MAVKWTAEQEQVIESRGSDMLVSAAAGSGKTAVLVERIIRLITEGDDPPDIDSLLVVTFTNAAASEMRERIREALEKKLEEDPENTHLQKQATLVHSALITTIHSFCLEVVRSSFPGVVEPGFRIADESETVLLKNEVLAAVMEEAHSEEKYRPFISHFVTGRDDRQASEQVMKLFSYSESYPWPSAFRQQGCEIYAVKDEQDLEEQPWMRMLLSQCRDLRDEACRRIRSIIALTGRPGGPAAWRDALEQDLERFSKAGFDTYEKARQSLQLINEWPALVRISKKELTDPALKELAQNRRNALKDEWKKLQSRQFALPSGQVAEILGKCEKMVRSLVLLTDRFEELYSNEKRDRGIVDFADLEHFALQLLVEIRDGKAVPTKTAEQYAARFTHIMTDEYQDSNLVQEYILQAVSGGGRGVRNRFMVGDVKQSIYRFRQARPDLFTDKYSRYTRVRPGTDSEDGGECLYELHLNFRSRPQILESVNRVFEKIMAGDIGGVTYDGDAMLRCGAAFPEPENRAGKAAEGMPSEEDIYAPVLYVLEDDKEDEDLSRKDREAVLVSGLIRSLVGSFPVTDRETGRLRPAKYSDIAVLLRTVKGWSDSIQNIFAEDGIPAYSGAGDGYFDTYEMRTVLAYLKLLDNTRQDIPLAAVLRSPIGSLTDSDLAMIRAACPDGSFYDACLYCMGTEGALNADRSLVIRLKNFFDRLNMLRAEVPFTPVHGLIWRVLDLTGFGDYAASMPGGRQRKANLSMLVEKAIAFEQGSYKGLYSFLQYVDRLGESSASTAEAPILTEGEDVVRIMSVHKSKGLEFPIVLLCGMGRNFNRMDVQAPMTIHQSLGIGCRYVDRERHIAVNPLPKQVIAGLQEAEDLGEEQRVLYVGMTRAREKLIMTGTVRNLDKSMDSWESGSETGDDGLLPRYVRRNASNWLDWIVPAIQCGDTGISLVCRREIDRGTMAGTSEEKEVVGRETAVTDTSVRDDWEKMLKRFADAARISGEHMTDIPGAVSVSEIKHRFLEQDEEAVQIPAVWDSGSDSARKGELSASERGTLYHAVMEYLDYASLPDSDDDLGRNINMQLETMMNCGKIHAVAMPRVLDPQDIVDFLLSDTGKRMRAAALAGTLHREQPFVLGMPARQVNPQWESDETVLVQGIIDAWFEEEDGKTVLVDYKTDRLENEADAGQTLSDRYRVQVEIYKEALERLNGGEVRQTLLYSFSLGRAIEI